MIVYADTSALMKLILLEPGTDDMLALVSVATRTTCAAIGYVEMRAALAAAVRQHRLVLNQYPALLAELEHLWTRVTEIAVDSSLVRQAGDLADRLSLRGYDAMHLSALQSVGMPGEVTFACWDGDLRTAAQQLGYTLIPS